MLKNKYLRALSINAATADNEGQWITNRNQSPLRAFICLRHFAKERTKETFWMQSVNRQHCPPSSKRGRGISLCVKIQYFVRRAFESLHACACLSSSDTFHFCASLAVKIFNLFSLGPSCHFSKQYKARYSERAVDFQANAARQRQSAQAGSSCRTTPKYGRPVIYYIYLYIYIYIFILYI